MTNWQSYKQAAYEVIGASMRVHAILNWGLLEPIYSEALHIELEKRLVEHEREKMLPCYYGKQLMEKTYRMDFVVGDIVVELKAVDHLSPVHRAQLFNYLRLTKKPVGLLINFGSDSLQGERYGYDEDTNECILLDRNMEPVYQDIEVDYSEENNNE